MGRCERLETMALEEGQWKTRVACAWNPFLGFSILCLIFAFVGVNRLSGKEVRVWTSAEGRTLEASLVEAGEREVTLRLSSGQEAILPLSRLSPSDREYIQQVSKRGGGRNLEPLPLETALSDSVEVKGGPRVFRSPYFEFRNDRDVSPAFVAEAARIYEGTLAALHAIPHGLELAPPEGQTHFRGRFLDETDFDMIAEERMGTLPGQRVVGLYLSDSKELLVPYSSLGAKQLGSRMTLRKSSDTSTLVHEIVHQVMHDWLPVFPTWFSEGLAEYLASIPNQNGRFMFRYAERGLKTRLEDRHGVSGRVIQGVTRPSRYFEGIVSASLTDAGAGLGGDREVAGSIQTDSVGGAGGTRDMRFDTWNGTLAEYRDAMLYLYFFMHLAEPEQAGDQVGRYLRAVDIALGETDQIRKEVGAFEKQRVSYNKAVRAYNEELGEFRKAVEAYNRKVVEYNDQVKSGVPLEKRIRVGEIPKLPVAPERPEMSESIRLLVDDRRSINLVHFVQSRSLEVLLDERSPRQLDEDFRRAFAELGWEVQFR